MFIVPISRMDGVSSIEEMNKTGKTENKAARQDFGAVLEQAIEQADAAQKQMEESDIRLAMGNVDDLHTALIQAEQAATAIEFTTCLLYTSLREYGQRLRYTNL